MDIKKQVASIQQSAISDPRFKHNEEVEITPEAVKAVEMIFNSMLPHFPAWRQTCPTDEDLGRLKAAWTKAIIRYSRKTGRKPNFKAGLLACEESETDWLPSVGKFLKLCEQSNDLMQFAERALKLFNSGQKQIDNVGRMVTGNHGFDLKQMKAADTNKRFIELYLGYAENTPIEALESHLLTETVQLSDQQRKEAEKRAEMARNEFLGKFSGLIADKPEEKTKKQVKTGIQSVKPATSYKSPAQLEKEKKRQLKAIGRKL